MSLNLAHDWGTVDLKNWTVPHVVCRACGVLMRKVRDGDRLRVEWSAPTASLSRACPSVSWQEERISCDPDVNLGAPSMVLPKKTP